MPTTNTDVIITVFHEAVLRQIGHSSPYVDKPHPGTSKKIEGWKWDKRTWPTSEEFLSAAVAPSIWDPSIVGIDTDLFQSGFGDNNDLLLLDILDLNLGETDNSWAPKVNHGYFYIHDEEWFLFSDQYLTEYFLETQFFNTPAFGNQQFVNLTHVPKPTIPILVRQYQYNSIKGKYTVARNFRKKVTFTVGGTDPEFILDDAFDPPRISLNGTFTIAVGVPVVIIPDDVDKLEVVGISDGSANQQYLVSGSPIDKVELVEVWTWFQTTAPTQWTIIDPLVPFTAGNSLEVKVDYEAGKLEFGDYTTTTLLGAGRKPPAGHRIGIHYTKGISVEYEPENTQDFVLGIRGDVNPVSSTNQGFVQITTEPVDPASITLLAILPQINPFLIDLGNNVGEVIATVKNAAGALLEGQDVTFNILDPKIGTFGASATTISAVTDSDGEATVFYNSPLTIDDVGGATATIDLVSSPGDTIVDVTGIVDPGSLTSLFIYKVHETDETLGILDTTLPAYYTDPTTGYLPENKILQDPDATTPATQTFEEGFRTSHGLLKPTTYTASELAKGKKTIMLITKTSGVVDPLTGLEDTLQQVLSPLFPSLVVSIGTATAPILRLTYTGIALDDPLVGGNDTKAYFIVGDAQTELQASVTSQKTNRRLDSNKIQMRVEVPDTANGSFFIDTLAALPALVLTDLLQTTTNVEELTDAQISPSQSLGTLNREYLDERLSPLETYVDWFRRTRKGDSVTIELAGLGLAKKTLQFAGEVPLGFRIRSTGISIASILDQITYLDPNDHLLSDYFDVESTVNLQGHKFEVN